MWHVIGIIGYFLIGVIIDVVATFFDPEFMDMDASIIFIVLWPAVICFIIPIIIFYGLTEKAKSLFTPIDKDATLIKLSYIMPLLEGDNDIVRYALDLSENKFTIKDENGKFHHYCLSKSDFRKFKKYIKDKEKHKDEMAKSNKTYEDFELISKLIVKEVTNSLEKTEKLSNQYSEKVGRLGK